MPRIAAFALLLALCLSPWSVRAESPYVDIEKRLTAEQLRATGVDTLSAEQLALLNQLLRDESEQVAKAVRAEVQQRVGQEPDTTRFAGLDDKPIRSRVQGKVDGWQPGTEFRLENGQVWKVLKGSITLREAMESPQIIVVPGIAGRWFLQVHEDYPKARVYRID